jgi:hypothetical protein
MTVVAEAAVGAHGRHMTARFVDSDLGRRIELRTELDRRKVPFTDGPQADDEALLAWLEVGLIRRGDDGRIGERGGLDGVLMGEVSADQELPIAREAVAVIDEPGDSSVVASQRGIEVPMTFREAGGGPSGST